ncbi:hypothetical protein P7H24_13380 [Enterococcus thailandicus]|uniref:hypothetical protein n=1 Tax=Enterococcus TaxID=1350 RepID=UPI0028917435|nr:hypothetical protein [Enterococcus thailandicus]MDT2735450.1 hypothetical protein [Enterococcus thailandicus]MDT2753151.1 hypothetical protein [Enterococcus thailandicus]
MNEKIENLIAELQNECKKNSAGVVLSFVDLEHGNSALMLAGAMSLQSIAVMMLNDEFKEAMKTNDCDCAICRATKEMMFHE